MAGQILKIENDALIGVDVNENDVAISFYETDKTITLELSTEVARSLDVATHNALGTDPNSLFARAEPASYRGFLLRYNPKESPVTAQDWVFWKRTRGRRLEAGFAGNITECFEQIDALIDDGALA